MGCAVVVVRDGLQDRTRDRQRHVGHDQGQSIDGVSEQHGLESAIRHDVHIPRGSVERMVGKHAVRTVRVAGALEGIPSRSRLAMLCRRVPLHAVVPHGVLCRPL